MAEALLVSIELRFPTSEDPDQVAERIKESVRMIVGGDRLEDFRVRTVPLTQPRKPRAV